MNYFFFTSVKPLERQGGEGVYKDEEKTKKLDMKLMEKSTMHHPTRKEGISLTAVEWEILWEDLQIGERIGIGKIHLYELFM